MNTILSRITTYTLLSGLVIFSYALLVAGLSILLNYAVPSNHPLFVGLWAIVVALSLSPLKSWLQTGVDSFFYRSKKPGGESLQQLSKDLSQSTEIPEILKKIRTYVQRYFLPEQLHIFFYDPLSEQYTPSTGEKGEITTDLSFPVTSTLVKALSQHREPLSLEESDGLPTTLQSERSRLDILGAELIAPFPGNPEPVGWLAIGRRKSGEPYTSADMGFLESISEQAAMAIERAQVVANLKLRVREMDVLTRVAQGINITPAFDDILELINTQTNLVIPSIDFRVTLRGKIEENLYHAFYLENDERLPAHENTPLLNGKGLEWEVVQSQQALVVEDYESACRNRGILPDMKGVFAWMGVPLNAGASTLGVISLASRESEVYYTDRQRNLLQAISDYAAGAIVKARLLQEAEQRSQQLSILNEIGRSLTSTLEIDPLLDQIMESAVKILDCEAGSLFMVAESSAELIFSVTIGPVASFLKGQRLPPGTGIAGKAVDTGEAIIVNDVSRSDAWFREADQQTGFSTRDILVVPLRIKDRIIGVIEVINKKDGMPFEPEDQELLSAFSGQAAIAIENARLYTQTDAALRDRLEEISVLQRVDRELNASLDLERTMRITLEWSMRQSNADAGLIGIVEEDQDQKKMVRLIEMRGYPAECSSDPGFRQVVGADGNAILCIELPQVLLNISEGQPEIRVIRHTTPSDSEPPPSSPVPASQSLTGLLPGARLNSIVPILRKSEVIAILLLESADESTFNEETLTFLSRLSDHAAIAISNAQLYADLQTANIAKSDFISFVSHELKTPMTSIKGYTDLILQGAVGPITEIQSNFLSTIRSNVDRMATLVSDLTDISRIETGRLRLDFKAVDVHSVIDEVNRSTQAIIQEKEQSVEIQIPDDLPLVWGDLNRMIQVLTNLVSNANKYTPRKGRISISIEKSANRWDALGAPEVIHIAVKDTGYGITPEDQGKIFQKFFRSEDQNVRETPGTGLGLNITRHLVEMQGGRIWFASQSGIGSTFHFTIPTASMK